MCQDPETFTSIVPFLIEDQIDDSQLDECSKSVLDSIKGLQNMDVAKILARFGADASIYKTSIKSQVAPSGQVGQTIRNSAYDYTIYISTDYTGKTKLMIAYTLMHKLVHTYFFSMIDDCYLQNNCDLLSTFPELWEYCVNHDDSTYPSDPIAHHEEIANTYLSIITPALQEYQPGLPLQLYEDIAWSGLMETSSFDIMHPANSASRQHIMNRAAAEQTGNPIATGTPNQQIPYGQPCN